MQITKREEVYQDYSPVNLPEDLKPIAKKFFTLFLCFLDIDSKHIKSPDQ